MRNTHSTIMHEPKSGNNPNVQAQNGQIVYAHNRLHNNKKRPSKHHTLHRATHRQNNHSPESQTQKSTRSHLTPPRGDSTIGRTTKGFTVGSSNWKGTQSRLRSGALQMFCTLTCFHIYKLTDLRCALYYVHVLPQLERFKKWLW